MARTQAVEVVKALRWMADGRAKSNPLWRAIRVIEDAMRGGDEVVERAKEGRE
jgi:hypothetical protein